MKESGKVLVIEDDPDWQKRLKKHLTANGYFVEIVHDLNTALEKVQHERFHFITLDMQLDENTQNKEKFEGWDILEIVKNLRIQEITPIMVITGFGDEYLELKKEKKVEALFFVDKGEFDKNKFIEIVTREVDRTNLRFKDDHRGGVKEN